MRGLLGAFTLAAFATACGDKKEDWVAQHQRQQDEAKAQLKQQRAQKDAAPISGASAPFQDPFFDAANLVRLTSDSACPQNFWALFPGEVPGDGTERAKNKQEKPALEKAVRAAWYVVKLHGSDVHLLEYDAPNARYPVEVAGHIDCQDSMGHIAVAWTPPKAIDPPHSAGLRDALVVQSLWTSEPMRFQLPMKSMSDARDFQQKHQLDLDARIILKLEKAEVHRKMIKPPGAKQAEDWGAGRLIHATVQATRLATDHNATTLLDERH